MPIAALVTVLAAGPAAALTPDSYDMLNGNTGTYNYWDETYSGSGNRFADNAPLSGGRGDLTDGIIATQNWQTVEAPPGNGPYVGWTLDPTITFRWNAPVAIAAVTFYFDDADFGDVQAPRSVDIAGVAYAVIDPPGSDPFAFTVSGLSFSGTSLAVTLHRGDIFVFLSEVTFAVPVPEPATPLLLLAGSGAVAAAIRRRRGAVRGRAAPAPA